MYPICAGAAHTFYSTSTIWSSKPAVKQLGPIASGPSRQRLLEVNVSDRGSRLLSLLCSHPVIWQPAVPRNPSAQFLSQEADSDSCSCLSALRGTGYGEPPDTPQDTQLPWPSSPEVTAWGPGPALMFPSGSTLLQMEVASLTSPQPPPSRYSVHCL